MKRIFFVFFFVALFITSGLWAQEQRGVSFGIRILCGGRYDNVRMCVGFPALRLGGHTAEILSLV